MIEIIFVIRRGDSNEYSQHMFSLRIIGNYPSIITKYPPYLFHYMCFTGMVLSV